MSLADEFSAAVCNLTPQRIGWLRGFGIPDSAIFVEPLKIGVANVQTFPSGFYEPSDDGNPAVIVAEGWPEPPIWDVIEDLIAFLPQDPGRWWHRRGEVQLLGAYNIRSEPVFPLALRETPLSWLQAGTAGVCVIDWSLDPIARLPGYLKVDSPQLKSRLERRIQQAALSLFDVSVCEVSDAA